MNLQEKLISAKFGILDILPGTDLPHQLELRRDLSRIIFIRAGGSINIDFTEFTAVEDELYFVRAGQYMQLGRQSSSSVLYYSEQLYFADVHDHELTWNGMLFNSLQDRPGLALEENACRTILSFYAEIRREMGNPDPNQETMVRMLVKQLIITAMRLRNSIYGRMNVHYGNDSDFSRYFDSVVDKNYSKWHSVADYARMFNISPKALNKRIAKSSRNTPSDIIHKRIILEAKRMLVHTPLTVKEIGYKLGYEDPSYFIRFFSKQVNMAPQSFRKYSHATLNAVA